MITSFKRWSEVPGDLARPLLERCAGIGEARIDCFKEAPGADCRFVVASERAELGSDRQ
ncbi:hypothetical protein [Bradyrhizobium sp. CCBAU 53421]|uniref:hypothetical protein n=1 Tax=Bradyrhizobium sp. CCBAU 53421 TaxID=1325120 RepID=UPI00188BC104|nr:hypothetical protein [Bradyrhizobium sp. CCBAU 53421]